MSDQPTRPETEADVARGAADPTVARWLNAWAKVDDDKRNKAWREKAQEVVGIYEAEGKSRHNILYSNTRTVISAVWSGTAAPDVRPRPRADGSLPGMGGGEEAERPAIRAAGRIVQRSLEQLRDDHDMDDAVAIAVEHYALVGRGVARVRYLPVMEKRPQKIMLREERLFLGSGPAPKDLPPSRFFRPGPDGGEIELPADQVVRRDPDDLPYLVETIDQVVDKQVWIEEVPWRSFEVLPATSWRKVPAIRFVHHMRQAELVRHFGKDKGEAVPLSSGRDGEGGDSPAGDAEGQRADAGDPLATAPVWEIWDKVGRKVIFLSPGYKDGVLAEIDDPLQLRNFWPCPRPLYGLRAVDAMTPVCEYQLYEADARLLSDIRRRIGILVDALKVRGAYDQTLHEQFEQILDGDDLHMEPVKPGAVNADLSQRIWLWPLEQIVQGLQQLYLAYQEVKQAISEVIGLADIQRGASRASESAAAQKIKNQWGSLPIQKRQRRVQRFVRELYALAAEVMAEKLDREHLTALTGVPVDDATMAILRNDWRRGFALNVQTVTTIGEDDARQRDDTVQLAGAVTQFVGQGLPAVQAGVLPRPAFQKLLQAWSRVFRGELDVEEALEAIGAAPPQAEAQGQAAQQAAVQAEAQAKQAEAQGKQAEAELRMQEAEQKAAISAAEHEQEMAELAARGRLAMLELQAKELELAARMAELNGAGVAGERRTDA